MHQKRDMLDLFCPCVGFSTHQLQFPHASQNDEFLRLVINGVHMDLTSRNEAFECLALSFLGSGEGGLQFQVV